MAFGFQKSQCELPPLYTRAARTVAKRPFPATWGPWLWLQGARRTGFSASSARPHPELTPPSLLQGSFASTVCARSMPAERVDQVFQPLGVTDPPEKITPCFRPITHLFGD